MRKKPSAALVVLVTVMLPSAADAQHTCQFYAQNPDALDITSDQALEREVEIVYTNTGTSTWQRTGGVSNPDYIELRPVDASGNVNIEGPLYHSSWINRKRVGSFLYLQNGVAPGQRARFVFMIRADGQILGAGIHDMFFRPYHAQGGYIQSWGYVRIRIIVSSAAPPPTQPPSQPPPALPQAYIDSVNPVGPYVEGQNLTFCGHATESPLEYRWEANGQLIGSSVSCQRSFTAGSYTISFKARNQTGWSNTDTRSLYVGPRPAPSPGTLRARIDSVVVQRTCLNGYKQGAFVENYDLVRSGSIPLKRYQTLVLRGSAVDGPAAGYEWSLLSGQLISKLGDRAVTTTDPEELPVGQSLLRLRVQDLSGNWSEYAAIPLTVEYWPKLRLPCRGRWTRSGSDYNSGYHVGTAVGAQDWNYFISGHSDFGLEVTAALSGRVSLSSSSLGGNIVCVEHEDPQTGNRFRTKDLHLSTIVVSDGDLVEQGQIIGLCGNTGSASQGSHLHHELQKWDGQNWVGAVSEPVFLNDSSVEQTVAYGETVESDNLSNLEGMIILPEVRVVAPNQDFEGWGNSKHWAPTVADIRKPTAYCDWEVDIPVSGWWRLSVHNPSGFTNDLKGAATHNTTGRAKFEITRPRQLGILELELDQAQTPKGYLQPLVEFYLEAGDRIQVKQHNATGEADKEMTFDELVFTLVRRDGSGGSSKPPQTDPPKESDVPVTSLTGDIQSEDEVSPVDSSSQTEGPPPPMGGGGGGGCALAPAVANAAGALITLCLLMLLLLSARMMRTMR